MEFWNELYKIIADFLTFLFESGLIKDTAMAFYNSMKNEFMPLILEYINILL